MNRLVHLNRTRCYLILISIFSLNGCAPLLIGAGIAAAGRARGAQRKRHELDMKEAYGRYRMDMQQRNLEPLLYEEWLEKEAREKKDSNKSNTSEGSHKDAGK